MDKWGGCVHGKGKIGRETDGLVGARKRGAEVGRKRGEGAAEEEESRERQLGGRVCDLLKPEACQLVIWPQS